ncbi:uncharacterized protein A1O9_10393 [Exophiala aquamarina CBS 119918]|uniref:Alcohol acetyltransferase n=1 Tax=Exophiala aquamarina CBS 119918 TaxID=1182545 RepID=A0A072P2B1_9EURO|nr:uncharacterized protein A1O9_10393 [Exophiala aquamarina CBS 119918]KEF53418.1 hypothetical protein A1O9_10393 [Exophiala aquamarina CBS 119918]
MSIFYKSCRSIDVVQLRGLIFRTMGDVILQHPALSAIPVDEDTPSPYFARLHHIDLAKATTFLTSPKVFNEELGPGELNRLLEEQHNANFLPFRPDIPVWRLVIVHEPENGSKFIACFVYHHAIADGTSGFAFHRSFLTALCEHTQEIQASRVNMRSSEAEQKGIHIVPTSEKALCQSLEALHPLGLSTSFILKSLWREYFSKLPPHFWSGPKITVDACRQRSRFQSIQFSQHITQNLVRLCRSQYTSVTAALEAALAAAVFTELPYNQYDRLRVDGAVSLRRWLPEEVVDENSMGNWVSRYLEEHRRPQHNRPTETTDALGLFSWDEARRIKATIDLELAKCGKDSVVGLLRFAGDLHKYFKGKVGASREESFEFSNVGVFQSGQQNASNRHSWQTGRVVFSQSADVIGAAFEVSLVTGEDMCLNIGFSWLEGVVQEQWMGKVIRTYEHLVDTIVLSNHGK